MSKEQMAVDRLGEDGSGPGERAPYREEFLNTLIGSLAETIENVVGLKDAEAFIGIVGRRMGQYEEVRLPSTVSREPADLAEHLRRFKESIGGDFRVESVEGTRIVFTNKRCPFASQVVGRPSLCMMTTNVFGRAAADATGYARVKVAEALARGDERCRVIVDLERNGADDGQEFYS